jgi:hypothetical protein
MSDNERTGTSAPEDFKPVFFFVKNSRKEFLLKKLELEFAYIFQIKAVKN